MDSMELERLAQRVERISANPTWTGNGDNLEGDIQDIRNAIHELRDCFRDYLRTHSQGEGK